MFSETFIYSGYSACFPVLPEWKHCTRVNFCFQDANDAFATQQRIFTKIQPYEHAKLQKFFKQEQASSHLFITSNLSKGQILWALSNWMRPFDTAPKGMTLFLRDQARTDTPTSFPGSLILPPGALRSPQAVRWETLGTRLLTPFPLHHTLVSRQKKSKYFN